MHSKSIGLTLMVMLLPVTPGLIAQGLQVDQASGTTSEVLIVYTQIPDNQIAQSFTPSLSAVGFVQLNVWVPAYAGNDQVTFVVNLREGAYTGPILSSTTPVVLVNKFGQFDTFYFPDNIPVTSGQLYFLEPVLQSTGYLNIAYKNPSNYPGGDAWNNGLQDTGDYWFSEGIVVPEPGTVALVVLGSGLFLLRRRVRRNL